MEKKNNHRKCWKVGKKGRSRNKNHLESLFFFPSLFSLNCWLFKVFIHSILFRLDSTIEQFIFVVQCPSIDFTQLLMATNGFRMFLFLFLMVETIKIKMIGTKETNTLKKVLQITFLPLLLFYWNWTKINNIYPDTKVFESRVFDMSVRNVHGHIYIYTFFFIQLKSITSHHNVSTTTTAVTAKLNHSMVQAKTFSTCPWYSYRNVNNERKKKTFEKKRQSSLKWKC